MQTNIRRMEDAAFEMQMQLRKLNQIIDDTENVLAGLNGCASGFNAVRSHLRKEIHQLEEEQYKYRNMMTTLQQIRRCYQVCENGIIDYAEENTKKAKSGFEWYSFEPIPFFANLPTKIIL